MGLWLLIIIAMVVQESTAETLALLSAVSYGLNLIIVHFVFVLATAFDIWGGYKLGAWALEKTTSPRIERFTKKIAIKFEHSIGERGKLYALTLIGFINFPYINGFLAAWLKMPLESVFMPVFIGDILSYLFLWGIVLGINTFNFNWYVVFIIVIVISIIVFEGKRQVSKKRR
jgi:membrane protein YqaA with SNARE-associated domain